MLRRKDLPPYIRGTCWLYVFAAGNTVVKIGHAVDLDTRLKRLQRAKPIGLEFYCAYATETSRAPAYESWTHQRVEGRRIADEWFLLSPAEAEAAIVAVLTEAGRELRRHPQGGK